MKTLSLLRHAKSDWQETSIRDFDRPLNEKGRRVSRAMGHWAASQKLRFDHIVASPAVRVMETLDEFIIGYGRRYDVEWERKIYLASSATILDIIRDSNDDYEHILVVGHNPGIEDIIFDLVADDGHSPLRDMVEKKYPTGAYAQLDINVENWAKIGANPTKFNLFMPPRDIDPSFGPDVIQAI